MVWSVPFIVGVLFVLEGCVAGSLGRAKKDSSKPSPDMIVDERYTVPEAPKPAVTAPNPASEKPEVKESIKETVHEAKKEKPSIYAIDTNTFRFNLPEDVVWDAMIDVLIKNYNLNSADRNTGLITTEWDSFYLKQQVYRNKITVHVKRKSFKTTDVALVNNVEKLQDAALTGSGVGAVWMPADDQVGEVGRILQNMAFALEQPAPILPPGMIAGRPQEPKL